MVTGNIVSIFMPKLDAASLEKLTIGIVESTKKAEDAFTAITFFENQWNNFALSHSQSSSEYMKKITDNWNNVRPLLESYAYGELPPLKKVQ